MGRYTHTPNPCRQLIHNKACELKLSLLVKGWMNVYRDVTDG